MTNHQRPWPKNWRVNFFWGLYGLKVLTVNAKKNNNITYTILFCLKGSQSTDVVELVTNIGAFKRRGRCRIPGVKRKIWRLYSSTVFVNLIKAEWGWTTAGQLKFRQTIWIFLNPNQFVQQTPIKRPVRHGVKLSSHHSTSNKTQTDREQWPRQWWTTPWESAVGR